MDEQTPKLEPIATEKKQMYRYAGFWMRFWAYLLDLLIVVSINGILVSPFLLIAGLSEVKVPFFTLAGILLAVVNGLYFLLLTKRWGQTIGKKVFGLKVISKKTDHLSWLDLIFREVFGRYILQAFTLSYTLYLVVAFQKEKQGLHDMIGDTFVVHEES
jgi:uncharacterized RDD family membrane protein YckC